MDIIIVPRDAVRTHWPAILPSLQHVISKTSPEWIPEEIFAELVTGQAFCQLFYVGGKLGGVAILEQGSEGALHIKVAHNLAGPDLYAKAWEHIQATARGGNFKSITFSSPRAGWRKRLKPKSSDYEVIL